VMDWWLKFLPAQGTASRDDKILNRDILLSKNKNAPDPEKTDDVMLWRRRLSRIFFLRKFFDYPISLSIETVKNLGIWRVFRMGIDYVWVRIFPRKPERNLEDFFINRFGKFLYQTFFEDYTKKVWGVPCSKIPSEWGAQRIKGLSVSRAIGHALRQIFSKKSGNDIRQKNTETSLIGQFFYPKLGPGQMWETVAAEIEKLGGEIHKNCRVDRIEFSEKSANKIFTQNKKDGAREFNSDLVFSSMPIKNLVQSFDTKISPEIRKISDGLVYRDFMTVGLLCDRLEISNQTNQPTVENIVPDNWIYIQERDVKIGRLQIFNNWSPYLVADPKKVWIGLEYFCTEGDELWKTPDKKFVQFAIEELEKIGIVNKKFVQDSVVIRQPKAYPAYFGTYDRFSELRKYLDGIENLFPIGRNGMHQYNNQDHSMLSAMVAVDQIISGEINREEIWSINVEKEYHEKKS